jgi:hypothetical protein
MEQILRSPRRPIESPFGEATDDITSASCVAHFNHAGTDAGRSEGNISLISHYNGMNGKKQGYYHSREKANIDREVMCG